MNFLDLYKKIQSLDKPVTEDTHVVHHYPNGQDDLKNTGVEEDGVELGASAAPPSEPAMPTDGATEMPAEEEILEPTATDIAPDQHTGDPVIQGEESEEESIMMMPAPALDMPEMPHAPEKQPDTVSMNVSMNGSGAGGIRDLMSVLRNLENGSEPSPSAHGDDSIVIGEPGDIEQEVPVDEKFGNSVHGDRGAHVMGLDAIIRNGNDMHSKGDNEPMKKAGGGNPYTESLVNKLTAMYEAIKEDRTEEKDKDGNVIRWKEEGEWTKSTAKKGGRGKVTNLSDKARRETEKLSKKEPEKMDESVSQMLALNKRLNG